MASSIRDWTSLPQHILDLIVAKFGLLSDYFTFPAVCSKWRDLNPSSNFFDILKVSRKEVPMLIINTEESDDDHRVLYNVFSGVFHDIQLPLPYKHRFIGSSYGWLFCLDQNMNITLVDPFTKDSFALPVFKDPFQADENGELCRTIEINDFIIYIKSGDDVWKFIDIVPDNQYASQDICYKGNIYSITYKGELLQIDFHKGTTKTIVPKDLEGRRDTFYLVESKDGELLMVKRVWDFHERDDGKDFETTSELEVFKLKESTNEEFATWDMIHDIGEQALFVGSTSLSISVSTLECSQFLRNSIYYTAHAYLFNPHYCDYEDSGIFNLKDESFHSREILSPLKKKYVQPPIWFVPNLK